MWATPRCRTPHAAQPPLTAPEGLAKAPQKPGEGSTVQASVAVFSLEPSNQEALRSELRFATFCFQETSKKPLKRSNSLRVLLNLDPGHLEYLKWLKDSCLWPVVIQVLKFRVWSVPQRKTKDLPPPTSLKDLTHDGQVRRKSYGFPSEFIKKSSEFP